MHKCKENRKTHGYDRIILSHHTSSIRRYAGDKVDEESDVAGQVEVMIWRGFTKPADGKEGK